MSPVRTVAAMLGALAVLAAAGCAATPPAVPAGPGAGACSLSIALRDLSPAPGSGPVVVAVWSSPESFARRTDPHASRRVPAERVGDPVVIDGLDPGTYAVTAYHDATGAGSMRRGAFGIPLDAWAVSGGASPAVPPSWRRARFELVPGRNEVILRFVAGQGR